MELEAAMPTTVPPMHSQGGINILTVKVWDFSFSFKLSGSLLCLLWFLFCYLVTK